MDIYRRLSDAARGRSPADEMIAAAMQGADEPLPVFRSMLGELIMARSGEDQGRSQPWWRTALADVADRVTGLAAKKRYGIDAEAERRQKTADLINRRTARLNRAMAAKGLEIQQAKNQLDIAKGMADFNYREGTQRLQAMTLLHRIKDAARNRDLQSVQKLLDLGKSTGFFPERVYELITTIAANPYLSDEQIDMIMDTAEQSITGGILKTEKRRHAEESEAEAERQRLSREDIANRRIRAYRQRTAHMGRARRVGEGLGQNARKLLGRYNDRRSAGRTRQQSYLETVREVQAALEKGFITSKEYDRLIKIMAGRKLDPRQDVFETIIPGLPGAGADEQNIFSNLEQ